MRKTTSNASRLCGLVAVCALACPCGARTVWTGPTITFTKPDYADWTLPENQDRMTDNVWITRKVTQGIFNIAQEAGYSFASPVDTEWAYGYAADYRDLTFAPWIVWNGQFPPGMVGEEAVVHLITDDIYIDIMFTSWTAFGQGGGFSYERSSPPGCFQVTDEEVVCHGDGDTFTYTVTGTDSCTGGESSYVFTASGGAVGEQMCFTFMVTGERGFCCSTEICVTIPDCTPECDLDGDGIVGIMDLLALLAVWGSCPDCGTPQACPADFDGDCSVGILDFLQLLGDWSP